MTANRRQLHPPSAAPFHLSCYEM